MIINFSHSKAEAFKHGFMKGFTAPLMLFGRHEMPKLQEVRTVTIPKSDDDWAVIGKDFSKVMSNYGIETTQTC